MTRTCTVCLSNFMHNKHVGRPPDLCALCRDADLLGTVRILKRPGTDRPVGLCVRRPGKKTKFVTVWLTPREWRAIHEQATLATLGILTRPNQRRS